MLLKSHTKNNIFEEIFEKQLIRISIHINKEAFYVYNGSAWKVHKKDEPKKVELNTEHKTLFFTNKDGKSIFPTIDLSNKKAEVSLDNDSNIHIKII